MAPYNDSCANYNTHKVFILYSLLLFFALLAPPTQTSTNLQSPALLDNIGTAFFALAIAQPPTGTTQVTDRAEG
jgi:hypothetical protein